MLKSEKERIVAELTDRLRKAQTLIAVDYRGLTMKEIDGLRSELLKHGARFSVVKNTLTRRAAEAAGADNVLSLLDGPTAIAFLEAEGDPVAVAKALADAARTTRILTVRGGVLDGKAIGEDEVKNLATLPATDVLRSQLVGAVAGLLTFVVGLFPAPLRDLVGVLQARIDQLGSAAADAAPEPGEPADLDNDASPQPEAADEEEE